MSDIEIDGLDRALIEALALSPRASWASLAGILGSDAGTLARRWRRLREHRLAALAVEPGPAAVRAVAVIEVDCAPRAVARVAGLMAAEPVVLCVDVTTGGRDIVAVAGAVDTDAVPDFVMGRLMRLPGVRGVRVAFGDSRVRSGSESFDALDERRRAQVTALSQTPAGAVPVGPDTERVIMAVLRADPRASWKDLADRTGLSPYRVRQALGTLLRGERLRFEMRLSPEISRKAVIAWFFGKADPMRLEQALDEIGRHFSVRFAGALHAQYDLAVCVRLEDMDDVADFLRRAARLTPGVRYVDRSIVMRSVSVLPEAAEVRTPTRPGGARSAGR
ncbi:Lrp/AsnC family transcriptional regulator [Streptomyces sp. NPDC090106]|uniref:Lrp/AsnC family transcriptional regulator n=1 Tax=Streptomyces sp. NPDC090106 TaxID=3365946 RepID=UPI00383014DB